MPESRFKTLSKAPREVRLPPFHRDWEMGEAQSFFMLTFQRDVSHALEKRILKYETGKKLLKIFTY